jgi:hypothetical protein
MADQYDDATLRKLLTDNGVDWDQKAQEYQQNRPMRTESVGGQDVSPQSLPNPIEILNVATDLGFNVPWPKIFRYLMCVAEGIMTKPLPAAAQDCLLLWGEPI